LVAGKAVFCEKPISQNERGVRACYEQAEKVNKPLFCSFNRFVHCLFQLQVASYISSQSLSCDTARPALNLSHGVFNSRLKAHLFLMSFLLIPSLHEEAGF